MATTRIFNFTGFGDLEFDYGWEKEEYVKNTAVKQLVEFLLNKAMDQHDLPLRAWVETLLALALVDPALRAYAKGASVISFDVDNKLPDWAQQELSDLYAEFSALRGVLLEHNFQLTEQEIWVIRCRAAKEIFDRGLLPVINEAERFTALRS